MPKIKASSIEELKARVNIYDVVSAYVSLKKSGSSYKGLSPFTTEKTPSFFVHPDKNYYYCFSTSQGGDIISFIRMKENLSFSEAGNQTGRRRACASRFTTSTRTPQNGIPKISSPTTNRPRKSAAIGQMSAVFHWRTPKPCA